MWPPRAEEAVGPGQRGHGGALFRRHEYEGGVADAYLAATLHSGVHLASVPAPVLHSPTLAAPERHRVSQGFEYCCEWLEHRLNTREHYAMILDKCYRELTILGFISLCVVFSNEFHLWHDHSDLLAFEFAHLLIFGVSMTYVLTTVIASNRLEATSTAWKRMANANTDSLISDLEKLIESGGGDPNGFKPIWISMFRIFSFDIWEDCSWKALRLMFLREFDLGVEFDYSKYVTMKLHHKLAHSLHVHPSTWTLVMLISLVFFGWKATVGDDGVVVINATGSGSGEVDEDRFVMAMLGIFVPAVLGWLLVLGQLWVQMSCTSATLKMLNANGCKCANDLPQLLRDLDAKVEMKHILPQLPMFSDCSAEFVDAIHKNLSFKIHQPGEAIYEQGDDGQSMVVICKGVADVKTQAAGGQVIGSLTHGDYAGETCLRGPMPRTATLVARTECAVFELGNDALAASASLLSAAFVLFAAEFAFCGSRSVLRSFVRVCSVGDEFPAAVADLLDFSATAEDKALSGEWSAQSSQAIAHHDQRVAAHAERLAELKAKKDAMNKDPDLKVKLAKLGGVAKGSHHAAKKLALSPVESAVKITKHTAAHAGVPGTGVAKTHAAHARHHSLDRMRGADDFLPHRMSDVFEEVSEITLLFNCFTVGFYGLHIAPVLIPNYFTGTNYILVHICVLLPALLLMVILAPVSAKFTCLLDCVVYKDQETIAEVYHTMTQLIREKNTIKKQLLKNGMKMAHDKGVDDIQMEIGVIAKLVFEDIDVDGGGILDYSELRDGLARLHIYLAAKEFRNIMECIDPDLDGRVTCEEFVAFLRASDEQLAHDEWRTFKKLMVVRKHVRSELIRRVMASEANDGSATVEGLLTAIFAAMDTDNSNTLSDGELREGFAAYGISLSSDDQQAISDYVAKESLEGELTLAQWLEFVKPDDAALGEELTTSPAQTFEQETGARAEEENTTNPDENTTNPEETTTNPLERTGMRLGSEDLAVV